MSFNFTKQQLFAATSLNQSLAVIAGAGTGKTRVLVERCKQIAGGKGQNLGSLLAITFTEKAAHEIIARLYGSLSESARQNIASAWIGTFHSFCARLINKFGHGHNNITDEATNVLLLRKSTDQAIKDELDSGNKNAFMLLDELGMHQTRQLVEEMLSFKWHAQNAIHLKDKGEAEKLRLGACSLFARAKKNLEGHLLANGYTDFAQLEIDALDLLKRKEVREKCQELFRHILVDECQDTNDIQIELIEMLFNPAKNTLFAVGDPRQSIYRFRGANPHGFLRIVHLIENSGGKCVDLSVNFRSTPEIISFVNDVAEKLMPQDKFAPLLPNNEKSNPGVNKILLSGSFESIEALRKHEAGTIAKAISGLMAEGIEPGNVAILLRSMGQAHIYDDALKNHKIPSRISGGKLFLEQVEVQDVLSFLNWCQTSHPFYETAVARSPLVGASDEELLDGSYKQNKAFGAVLELKKRHADYLPCELMEELLFITGYKRMLSELDLSFAKLSNVEHLVEIARSQDISETLSDFLEATHDLKDRSVRWGDPPAASSAECVSIMSVHAAKGLEWDVVFLPDLSHKPAVQTSRWRFSLEKGLAVKSPADKDSSDHLESVLSHERIEEDAEERRLIYVALTRAKKGIFIPHATTEKAVGVWDSLLRPLAHPLKSFVPKDTPTHAHKSHLANERFKKIYCAPSMLSVSQIEAYDRCPQEFYLRYRADEKRKPTKQGHCDRLAQQAHTLKKTASSPIVSRECENPTLDKDKYADKLPAHIRGRIIHSYINLVCQGMPDKTALETAALEEAVHVTHELQDEAKKSHDFILDHMKKLDIGYHELPFSFDFKGTLIAGIIDWLRPAKDGWQIVDFKTDDISAAEVSARAHAYELQLLIYAYAMQKAGMKVSKTTLLFTKPQKAMDRIFTSDDMNNTKDALGKVLDGIGKNLFDQNPGNCKACPFGSECKG